MGKKGSIPKNRIKQEQSHYAVRAHKKEIEILGLISEEISTNSSALRLMPYVALKYFQSDWQSFSDWEKKELEAFSRFLSDLSKHTWEQVYKTGSKIPKYGLGYTKYNLDDVSAVKLKNCLKSVAAQISEEISFFELRVNQEKLRVHGFQSQSVFFLVALDRNHEAFPF